MPLPPIFQKKGIFLFYWLLILPLAGYLVYDHYTDQYEAIAPVLVNTNTEGLSATRQANEASLMEVYKWTDAYPTEDNKTLRRQAEAAVKQTKACQNRLSAVQAKPNHITHAELNNIAAALRQLADSLLLFADRDSMVAADLTALLYQPADELQTPGMVDFFKYARTIQIKLYLDDQIWKMELALRIVLNDISGNVYHDDIRFYDYLPVLIAENCARAGKPFSGKIYLHGYSRQAENVKYFIDGRECDPVNGLVKYRDRFLKPGVYTRQFKAQVINPLTKEVRSYTKDFQITIQQP